MNWKEFELTGENLSKLTDEQAEDLYRHLDEILPVPTEEQKIKAWKRMDTGIYDKYGNIIGDKFEEEDAYEET